MTLIYLSLSARLDYGLHEGGMVCFAYPYDFTEYGTNQISISVDHRNTQVSVDQDDRACFWSLHNAHRLRNLAGEFHKAVTLDHSFIFQKD